MRLAAILLASALCTGCMDMTVTSETPLFGPGDEAGAPRLRDGIWLHQDPECRFNTRRPVARWPGCARWSVMRGAEWLTLADTAPPGGRVAWSWNSKAYILAGGDPRILQSLGSRRPPPEGKAWAQTSDPFAYWAVRPTGTDGQGRITGYDLWTIDCDQTDPPDREIIFEFKDLAEADKARQGGEEPVEPEKPNFPGFADREDVYCSTTSAQAVRDAARQVVAESQAVLKAAELSLKTRAYVAEARAAGVRPRDARAYLQMIVSLVRPKTQRWVRDLTDRDFTRP